MGPDFDPLLLSQARLGIVSVLMTRKEATFTDLKSLLGMTQGNLGVHLRKLEDGGYVRVTKSFVKRKPLTTAALTPAGRKAFLGHLATLEDIARDAEA
ncbi:MAG: transcriptional regulator [Planctomycetota bacterium]|nr:transcriptional regulator [Planctomycetota bacterium]